MKIRLKTRAILAYLCAVSCGAIFFGLYFLITPPIPALKSNKGIDRAARDSWSALHGNKQALLRMLKPDIGSILHRDDHNAQQLIQEKVAENAPEQQHDLSEHVLYPPNTEIVLPPKSRLLNISWEELSDLYHSYTQQIQTTCKNMERLGKITDGGWEVCEDPAYKPAQTCLIYSFGVGEDFSFDDSVAKRYGCEVHSFDPSMKREDHQRESSVMFHAFGLANFSGTTSSGWKMFTLPDIRTNLGHAQKPLSILKLDIEEWEWKVLPPLLKGGHLSDTRQLLMELHQCDGCSQYNPEQIDKEPPKERYILALGILKDLHDIGFRIFWHHQNKACSYVTKFGWRERNGCCEIHMVRGGDFK